MSETKKAHAIRHIKQLTKLISTRHPNDEQVYEWKRMKQTYEDQLEEIKMEEKHFIGCPLCGEEPYHTRFAKTDHHGMPLLNKNGLPLMECRYAPEDGTPKWKRQLYWCHSCGHIYDRRKGLKIEEGKNNET